MKYNAISYLICEGFRNVLKNKKSTLSCLGIMCATMIIFGIFFAISQNINHIMDTVEDAQGMQVFLTKEATEEQINAAKEQISNVKVNGEYAIATITQVSKQEALDQMKKRINRPELMDAMEVDRFSVSFVITLQDLGDSQNVQDQISKMDNVRKITSSDKTINALLSIGNGITIFTLVILVVLVVISLFIISNTIKLTVHARRKEISIMKYVGATNNFIRAPFIVEGIIIGLIAGILSTLVVCIGYNVFASNFLQSSVVQNISNLTLLGFGDMVDLIIIVYVVLGVGIGIIGSTISMRKYLDV